MIVTYNDAWESVYRTDVVAEQIVHSLEPQHPLRSISFTPLAKLWRRETFIIEQDDDTGKNWLLDFHRRSRRNGKRIVFFRTIKDQADMDTILHDGLKWWVQYMKDAEAWNK